MKLVTPLALTQSKCQTEPNKRTATKS